MSAASAAANAASSMASIEEIVKFQQELLNHQRNQKAIQKETIKLLNALNKNISVMSDRLDQFALRTNMKLTGDVGGGEVKASTSKNRSGGSSSSTAFNPASAAGGFDKDPFEDVFNSVINTCNSFNFAAKHNGEMMMLTGAAPAPAPAAAAASTSNRSSTVAAIIKGRSTRTSNNSNSKIKNILSRQQQQQHHSDINMITTTTLTINNNNNMHTTTGSHNLATGSSPPTSSSKLADKTNTTLTYSSNKLTTISDESIDDDMSYNNNTSGDEGEGEEEDEDEEKETIQVKKKSKIGDGDDSPTKDAKGSPKETEESNNQQRLFNKYVRESVERRLGKDFLLMHEIQEIAPEIMEDIKNEAMQSYPPINIRPRRAWHLAKASLRCRRRSLRRQKEKQIKSEDEHSTSATPLQ